MDEKEKPMIANTHQRAREFLAEMGAISWVWSVVEETLDKSIEKISGLERRKLKVFLPTANVRRKFQIFEALLKENNYPDTMRKIAHNHSDWLLKLHDQRNDFVHRYWLTISIDENGEAFGAWLNEQSGQERIQKTYIEELHALYRDLHKGWIDFLRFVQENGLYT